VVGEPGGVWGSKEDIDGLRGRKTKNMSTAWTLRTAKHEGDARRPWQRTGGRAAAIR
jgi:hypothetical protein